ncbi:MAG TPA: GTPase [Streptosporangiaceae bacterium]|jgi:energy-coupling factor transporter ATP-binding protein EcfA2
MTEGRGVEPHVRVDARQLETALMALRLRIMEAPLQLEAPGVVEARAQRRKLLSQIDDYLLPRIRQSAAPILVALVGSTGAGKSTLVNSVVGAQVSQTGIRRPTTNSPVLACHPDDMDWFAENVFLPTLPRVRQQGLAMPGRDGLLVLAASEGMPKGVAVLDTPDIDSVVAAHHEFAHQFLDASDLWLFVTTASRYADAPVWELLRYAKERDAALGIVLSRVPAGARNELVKHFGAMLEANGLGKADRFVIPETIINNNMLPPALYMPVKEWLQDAALREDRRVAVLTQTMSGVLDTFRTRVPELAAHLATQLALRVQLRQSIDACYAAALTEVDEATRNGSLLRGETLARWQDFAGTGDLLRTLQTRRRARAASHTGKRHVSARTQALKEALRSGLQSLIVSIGDRAAEEAVARWRDQQAGAALLDQMPKQPLARPTARPAAGQQSQPSQHGQHAHSAAAKAAQPARITPSGQPDLRVDSPATQPGRSPFEDDDSPYADTAAAAARAEVASPEPYRENVGSGDHGHDPAVRANGEPILIPGAMALSRSSPDLARRAAQAISSWQDHVMHLVQAENVTKRSVARVVSFDDESLALVLTVGLLGFGAGAGTPGDGEGTSAAAHRLLSSLFGPGPLRDISTKAREDLRERIRLLFDEEMLRFAELIDAEGVPDEAAAVQLYQATYSLEVVR